RGWRAARLSRDRLLRLDPEFLAALAALRDVEKKLLERDPPPDQALLVRIAHQGPEIVAVPFREPVFPGIRAEDFRLLLPMLAVEDERHDARILHALHGDRLGLVEGVIHVDRNP